MHHNQPEKQKQDPAKKAKSEDQQPKRKISRAGEEESGEERTTPSHSSGKTAA